MKNHFKNGSQIGRPARFVVALVCLYLGLCASSVSASSPSDMPGFDSYALGIAHAYAVALAYVPSKWSDGMTKTFSAWAYDSAGHSGYALYVAKIYAASSVLNTPGTWANSGHVLDSSYNTNCVTTQYTTHVAQCDPYNYIDGCGGSQWTQGNTLQGTVCSQYGYVNCQGFSPSYAEGNTCTMKLTGLCIYGQAYHDWATGKQFQSGMGYSNNINLGGGFGGSYYYNPGCDVMIQEQTTYFTGLPLSSEAQLAMVDVVATMNQALGNDNLLPSDRSEMQQAKGAIASGFEVDSDTLVPPEVVPPVCDVLGNCETPVSSSAPYSVGGTSVTVNVNIDLSSTNAKLDTLISIASASAADDEYRYVGYFSTSTLWPAWLDFSATMGSSSPVTGLVQMLVPTSSDTWRPCFEFSGLWSGMWRSARPQVTEVCLTQFAGWETFVSLLKKVLLFTAFAAGVWGLIELEGRIKWWAKVSIFSQLGKVALFGAVGTAMVSLNGVLYHILLGMITGWISSITTAYDLTLPTQIIQMANYCGVFTALNVYLAFLGWKWQMQVFLSFWGLLN